MYAVSTRLKQCALAMMPPPLKRWVKEKYDYYRTIDSPDRLVLLERIIPAVAARGGTILWIGCRRYTQTYPVLFESKGLTCWTLEIDPAAACFGHPTRHITGSLLDAERLLPRRNFDAILCNGVFGFGINDPAMQRQALEVMANMLAPDGWLILGWNTDRVPDPITLVQSVPGLRPAPYGDLPRRIAVDGITHVYDFFQKA